MLRELRETNGQYNQTAPKRIDGLKALPPRLARSPTPLRRRRRLRESTIERTLVTPERSRERRIVVNWTQLLKSEIESTYTTTAGLLDKVDPDNLDWKPDRGGNWMTVGQLLKHITNACGGGCKGFVSGDWGLPAGVKVEDLSGEEMLPPAEGMPGIASVEEAKKLLSEDKAAALRIIDQAGENDLAKREVAAPWAPEAVFALGWHLLKMVQHLDRHKAQLFYYLKLQGKPVNTADLWG
jgi:hypothetical protein